MKNVLTIVFLFCAIISSNAQNLQADFAKELDKSGEYLQKSTLDITYSISSAVLSGACIYWASTVVNDDPNEVPYLQYSLAGVFGAVSIVSYVRHVVHIGKAGDHLRKANEIYLMGNKQTLILQQNTNGVGLAYKF